MNAVSRQFLFVLLNATRCIDPTTILTHTFAFISCCGYRRMNDDESNGLPTRLCGPIKRNLFDINHMIFLASKRQMPAKINSNITKEAISLSELSDSVAKHR